MADRKRGKQDMPDKVQTHLRKLRPEDARPMLEWMHDTSVVEHLHADFRSKTLQDCQHFIQASQDIRNDLHFAVVDASDAYMGTVSLKNIDRKDGTAEFGICMHPAGTGKGLSKAAMAEILAYGYQTLGLKTVYWCVSAQNLRANRFYQKNGYRLAEEVPARIQGIYQGFEPGELIWYCAEQEKTAARQ